MKQVLAARTPGLSIAHAPAAGVKQRLEMFDAMRFLAGVGVIWFHSVESAQLGPSGVLGRFSVAFFTIMGVVVLYEGVRKYPQRTLRDFAARRFRRLYLPFLGWSAIIGAVLVLLHEAVPAIHPAVLHLELFITGTAEPLWFIPFFILGNILIFPLAQWMKDNPRRELTAALLCGILALALDWIPWNHPPLHGVPLLGRLLELSWNRWSALYWGVVVAVLYSRGLRNSRFAPLLAFAGLLLTAALCAYQWHTGVTAPLKVLGGIGLAFVALAPLRGSIISFLGGLAPYSFGIYLSHALWILLARTLVSAAGLPVSPMRDLNVFLAALFASVISLRLLARHPSLRWLAGIDTPAQPRTVTAAKPVAI